MAKRRRKKKPGGRLIQNRDGEEDAEPVVLPPLPEEIAEDIFLRLPIKSLAASRCVSPSWNAFISSPIFAGRHHATAAARAVAGPRFVSVHADSNWHHQLAITTPRETIPKPFFCGGCPRVFCGNGKPCRGAVLVGKPCEGEFFLCNPSTGGALHLPPRRPPWYFLAAGLGYDAAGSGTYKAVLLERASGHPPPRWWVPRLQCVVATVGGAGHWRWRAPRGRKTPIICEDAVVSPRWDPVFADGRLHWMLVSRAGTSEQQAGPLTGVLAFTLDSSESFARLPLPLFDNKSLPEHATLAELDGTLCLLRDLRRPRNAVALFEVWKLRDYGRTPPSWSLERRIDLTPHIGKELKRPWEGDFFVVTSTSSGNGTREILLATTTQRAYVFEPHTGELRTVATRNCSVPQRHMRHLLYQESLVQVQGMEYGNNDIEFTFADERALGPAELFGLLYALMGD
ncbi:hypothetical protein QOZ80_4AG0321250 [Eleusine coracana subsp. coracana]|nr:hypothetical protein QOZ80_4AG0321250 [Eleusine coracana subsp. coracana]